MGEGMEDQYDLGHWTGGNIPPHIKYAKRPSRLILILFGVIIMAFPGHRLFVNLIYDIAASLLDAVIFFIGGVIAISNFKEIGLNSKNRLAP